MSTAETIILIVALLLLVLAVGGAIARRRQLDATRERFEAHLDQVNQDLAEARAGDRGWDPERMEAAARAAVGGQAEEVHLWRVVDKPGTDSDEAVYRVVSGGTESHVTLARRGDDWHPAQPG